jgi:hypothetical protein
VQAELIKEDRAQLKGGLDIERLPGVLVYFVRQPRYAA